MNLTLWQTLFLALLQGVTELFPISSLGHTVILPGLLGWGDLVRDKHC
jgi:undecaprenyl-diphosphatase